MSIASDYIFFSVRDFTGTSTVTGYALDICPFTFIPSIDQTRQYSSNKILWDFGDGTTSTTLCATHYYKFPGTYNVSLYVFGKNGKSKVSSFTQQISINNFITDTIELSSKSNYIIEAGKPVHNNGIDIIKYNSWQTYSQLSAQGNTINLFASGGAININSSEYYSDKYSHLYKGNKFYTKNFNKLSNKYENIVVNSIQTDDTLLYAKIVGNSIVLCDSSESGSTFVGVYGTKKIFFISDYYNIDDFYFKNRKKVFIYASFDTSKFDDRVSFNENYYVKEKNRPKYNYLNTIFASRGFVLIPPSDVSQLSFTTNGIDGEGESDDTFYINPDQYVATKVPITIKLKTSDWYNLKTLPTLSSSNTVVNPYELKISVLSGDGGAIAPGASPVFVRDDRFAFEKGGGMWKGYLFFSKEYLDSNPSYTLNNLFLSAHTKINQSYSFLKDPTLFGVIGHNKTGYSTRINFIDTYKTCSGGLQNSLNIESSKLSIYTPNLSTNFYQIIPDANVYTGSYYSIFTINLSSSRIQKFNTFGEELLNASLSSVTVSGDQIQINNNINYITANSKKDIWGSFADTVSSFKISGLSGTVISIAVPNRTSYPVALDTDIADNLWVAATFNLSGDLFKFNTDGYLLSSISLSGDLIPYDVVVTRDNNIWIGLRSALSADSLSSYSDKIAYHKDIEGSTTTICNVSGRVSNLTPDLNNGIYFIQNNTTIVSINSAFQIKSLYVGEGLNNISNTTNREIAILDNNAGRIIFIDPDTFSISNIYNIKTESTSVSSWYTNGDWTGFKWINKFSARDLTLNYAISGISRAFNVYRAEDRYTFGKFGESFDATNLYKNLRYQEALLDDSNMFDDFIGTIVGNISSSPNTIGKRVYEKATNFVDNVVDVDVCNIDSLYSIYSMLDIKLDNFAAYKFAAPSNIRRLIDTLSIKQSKLWGARNQFNRNFDIKQYYPGGPYGSNLGQSLDIQSTILTAGSASQPIVARSKFSGKYIYINTDILSSQYVSFINDTTTYYLSDFSTKWGWPLVLPENANSSILKTHYDMFAYKPGVDGEQLEGIINWGDITNKLSESLSGKNTWFGKNQAVENIIKFALYEGLNLFDSSSGTN